MTTKVRSNKGSKSPAPPTVAPIENAPISLAASADLAPPSSVAPESLAATSGVDSHAPSSLSGKPKKKKKKGSRKSKAGNGTLDLTPSTAAPPVVAKSDPHTDIDPD